MSYRIAGLDPRQFAPLWAMTDDELARHRAVRVRADADRGFPCRITLEDAHAGESLILVNHEHQSADSPYRSSHAIYVREGVREAAAYCDRTPPVFEGRTLSLRGFDACGMMIGAQLAQPGQAEAAIRALLQDERVAYIDAHNAARGCFAARIERDGL